MALSRFIHVAAKDVFFFFETEFHYVCVYVYTCIFIYHIFFIHSPVDRHLGYIHVLGIINSVTMNSGVHASV